MSPNIFVQNSSVFKTASTLFFTSWNPTDLMQDKKMPSHYFFPRYKYAKSTFTNIVHVHAIRIKRCLSILSNSEIDST